MRNVLLAAFLLVLTRPAFAADIAGKTPVRTVAIGDVTITLAGADNSTIAQVAANNGAAIGSGITVLAGLANSTLPAYTAGRAASPSIDLGGRLYVTGDASMTALLSNLTKVNGSAISLGQTTMSASLPVTLASNQSALAVTPGAPSGATTNRGAATNVASAATSTITCVGSLTASTPMKLYQVEVTGAAQGRCTIRYNNNASTTNWFDVVTSPTAPTVVSPCPAGFCGLTTGSTGTQAVEASCTNFDSAAQDFQCSVQYCISATGC